MTVTTCGVQAVKETLRRSVRIALPPSFRVETVAPFVRECCRVAWECSALAHPLEVAPAYENELFDDRRSAVTAPLQPDELNAYE